MFIRITMILFETMLMKPYISVGRCVVIIINGSFLKYLLMQSHSMILRNFCLNIVMAVCSSLCRYKQISGFNTVATYLFYASNLSPINQRGRLQPM